MARVSLHLTSRDKACEGCLLIDCLPERRPRATLHRNVSGFSINICRKGCAEAVPSEPRRENINGCRDPRHHYCGDNSDPAVSTRSALQTVEHAGTAAGVG